jgi:hypothetical protein
MNLNEFNIGIPTYRTVPLESVGSELNSSWIMIRITLFYFDIDVIDFRISLLFFHFRKFVDEFELFYFQI